MTADFRNLEILVAKIQAQLAPDAEVIHNTKLPGRISGVDRQIDVLVRQRIGQYAMLIVLDTKDHRRPVDVKGVEEFHGLVQDVGAHKGVLVCPKGFTEAAKTRAIGYQLDLYSPVDTDPHKWQVKASAPVICDFRSAGISIRISTSAPLPLMLSNEFHFRDNAYDENGAKLGIPFNLAMQNWNQGKYPVEPGEYDDLPIYAAPDIYIDNGYGQQCPVELTASILVTRQLFFGNQSISKLSGFRDELSGMIITNAFTMGIFNPEEVIEKWEPINSVDEAPTRPLLTLFGLLGWDADEAE